MPIHIDPERRDYPHFVPESLDGRITDFLRRQKSDYPLTRVRTELRILNDVASQIHSLTWRAYQLDERKAVLQVDSREYGVVARPQPEDDLGGASLFRKPGARVLVEATGPNEAQQRRIAAELEEVSGEVVRLREQRASLQRQAYPLAQRLASVKKFLNQRVGSNQSLRCLPLPKVDGKQTLEKLRAAISQLTADVKEFEAAPVPSAIAKARAAEWAKSLARGPYAHRLIDPDGQIDLPRTIVGDREEWDAIGLIAWLHRDSLIAALSKQIDECADDTRALDDATRAARIREAREKIASAELQEEAACWARLQEGQPVELRADASPAAILCVEKGE